MYIQNQTDLSQPDIPRSDESTKTRPIDPGQRTSSHAPDESTTRPTPPASGHPTLRENLLQTRANLPEHAMDIPQAQRVWKTQLNPPPPPQQVKGRHNVCGGGMDAHQKIFPERGTQQIGARKDTHRDTIQSIPANFYRASDHGKKDPALACGVCCGGSSS